MASGPKKRFQTLMSLEITVVCQMNLLKAATQQENLMLSTSAPWCV
jgi:hypothetical protein